MLSFKLLPGDWKVFLTSLGQCGCGISVFLSSRFCLGHPLMYLVGRRGIKHHFMYFMHFIHLNLIRSTAIDWQFCPCLVVFYRMEQLHIRLVVQNMILVPHWIVTEFQFMMLSLDSSVGMKQSAGANVSFLS